MSGPDHEKTLENLVSDYTLRPGRGELQRERAARESLTKELGIKDNSRALRELGSIREDRERGLVTPPDIPTPKRRKRRAEAPQQ